MVTKVQGSTMGGDFALGGEVMGTITTLPMKDNLICEIYEETDETGKTK